MVSRIFSSENRSNTSDDISAPQVDFDVMINGEGFADEESQAIGSSGDCCTIQASHQAEEVTLIEPTVTAGTSRSRRVCTISRRMADSILQWDLYGTSCMHYLANQSTTAFNKTPEDLFYNHLLELQERMWNPIALHTEKMGDIMYYNQAMKQPDAK
jgi:hypothetical protein